MLALGASVLLLLLATLPPFVGDEARAFVMWVFAGLCHQLPDRSPHVDGVALAVCHRCYGIYWGLPLAALAFLALQRWDARISRAARFLVPAAVAVPGADWLADVLGLWTNTPASRFVTGGVFGLVAGYFLARAFVELFVPREAERAVAVGERETE